MRSQIWIIQDRWGGKHEEKGGRGGELEVERQWMRVRKMETVYKEVVVAMMRLGASHGAKRILSFQHDTSILL